MQSEDEITITPQSKNHAQFLMVLGFCLLCCSLLITSFFWSDYKFQLMVPLFASIIIFVIGLLKHTEPQTSYILTRKYCNFVHRNGFWRIKWNNIVRIGSLTSIVKSDRIQLPYIGVKLKNIEDIAENISPRLANRLIHEQKELLILAAKNHEIHLDNGLISFDPFILNGKTYKGPIAAWLFRTEQLNQAYGYHLYLPETSFDRTLSEFLCFLKRCKDHSFLE